MMLFVLLLQIVLLQQALTKALTASSVTSAAFQSMNGPKAHPPLRGRALFGTGPASINNPTPILQVVTKQMTWSFIRIAKHQLQEERFSHASISSGGRTVYALSNTGGQTIYRFVDDIDRFSTYQVFTIPDSA
jgi:hypothetical protein